MPQMRHQSDPSARDGRRHTPAVRLTILLLALCLTPAAAGLSAQTHPDSAAAERREREQAARLEAAALEQMHARVGMVLDRVRFEQLPAADALVWFQTRTQLPLVIHWPSLEVMGIDRQTPLTVDLEMVPAARLLDLILDQMASIPAETVPEAALVYDVTAWYVHVMTKADANRHPVLRVYDVRGLTAIIPSFTDAPQMDLSAILRDDRGFTADTRDQTTPPTREQRGQALAQIIRDTIEPTIWQAHGGQYSSIRYHDGRLIVNAPLYVHRRIVASVLHKW
jgi:hypothetical protein